MTRLKKRMKRIAMAGALALLIGASALSAPSFACSSMGPDKHIGVVQEIDPAQGTLVLLDAETGKPIHFVGSAKLLQGVKVKERTVIAFKTEGDRKVIQDLQVR